MGIFKHSFSISFCVIFHSFSCNQWNCSFPVILLTHFLRLIWKPFYSPLEHQPLFFFFSRTFPAILFSPSKFQSFFFNQNIQLFFTHQNVQELFFYRHFQPSVSMNIFLCSSCHWISLQLLSVLFSNSSFPVHRFHPLFFYQNFQASVSIKIFLCSSCYWISLLLFSVLFPNYSFPIHSFHPLFFYQNFQPLLCFHQNCALFLSLLIFPLTVYFLLLFFSASFSYHNSWGNPMQLMGHSNPRTNSYHSEAILHQQKNFWAEWRIWV